MGPSADMATAGSPALACAVARGDGPDALAAVARPGVGAAIWERRLPEAVAGALDAAEGLAPLRLRLEAPAAGRAAADWAAASGLAAPVAAVLAGDVAALAARFGAILNAKVLRLRLDVIEDDACARLHVDRVRARLLCTLRGSGTEIAPVDAEGRPGAVERLPRGAVAILRGTLWPGPERTGVLHRSPPIAGTGERRLLLVLDEDAACGGC